MNNIEICIYCGQKEGTTRDHIPPRCFFEKPLPDKGIITVPCCEECHENIANSKIDERVRNIVTSLFDTETHKSIVSEIGPKRMRSLTRGVGSNLVHISESMKNVDIFTPSGIYLETRKAFNLDQPIFSSFFNRMTRALYYVETGEISENSDTIWQPFPPIEGVAIQALKVFPEKDKIISIGNSNEFRYVRVLHPKLQRYFFLMWFYDGFLAMTFFNSKERNNTPKIITPNFI